MRSPVDAAKGHILKSTLVESFIILPRLYGLNPGMLIFPCWYFTHWFKLMLFKEHLFRSIIAMHLSLNLD